MQDSAPLFEALGRAADAESVRAITALVHDAPDGDLVRLNPLDFADRRGLDPEKVIAALLQATRLGIFELSWNVLCSHCRGVIDANASIKGLRQSDYHCVFCAAETELSLDEGVENSFTVSPRVRRIAAHTPETLSFWDYFRQVFFSSGVAVAEADRFDSLVQASVLEAAELAAGERMILSLQLPALDVIVFDPVTHRAQFIDICGEPTLDRQDFAVLFDGSGPSVTRTVLRPGPLRLSLDNRAETRVLAGVFIAGPELEQLFARRPFLTAKRLLSNQTFRDIFRTDTLDVDQGLKILSLTFLFTDLKGSTALYERVGDLTAYQIVRAHFRILQEIVASCGGAVVKTIGDAVMATFPSPDRAVAAALRMRDAMRELNTQRGTEDILLKIGIHEGPCLAVSLNERQDFFGQTVNIAARIQALATADSVLASESVVRAAEAAGVLQADIARTLPRMESLRGIAAALPVFELT